MGKRKGGFGKLRRLSVADQWLVTKAAFWLGLARMMLALVPFERLVERLAAKPSDSPLAPDPAYLDRVKFAVSAAANNVPWRSDCFPRAIAARMLLKRQGYSTTIHLGVENVEEGGIAGHASLTCGETVVTGGEDLARYTEMHRISA